MQSKPNTAHANLPTGADIRSAVKEIGAEGAASVSFYSHDGGPPIALAAGLN